jgi:hypothetical protein
MVFRGMIISILMATKVALVLSNNYVIRMVRVNSYTLCTDNFNNNIGSIKDNNRSTARIS